MKLYARRGFEWAEDGLVGLWSPVSTGGTQSLLLDCNPSTDNHALLINFANLNSSWVGSEFGTVLDFDAINDYVNWPKGIRFPASYAITLSFWFYPTQWAGGNPGLMRSGSSFSGNDFFIFQGATGLPWIRRNGTDVLKPSTGESFGLNQWQHCVFSSTASSAHCFRNGLLIHTSTHSVAGAAVEFFGFGVQGAALAEKVAGRYAHLTIHNRPLYQSEILEIYQSGPGGMWQDRPRRSRVYFGAAGFKAYWAKRQSQLIGGGV